MLTVETYLARPAAAVEVACAADYFRATRALAADPAVAERGREAGTALGADPAAAVAEIAARMLALVATRDGTELMTTAAGGMRLRDYLPTRTFELAVHTTDLAAALGVPPQVPATAATQALHLITDLAVADGGHDRIVEVSVVLVSRDGVMTGEWTSLVNAGRYLGPQEIHGISAADMRHASTCTQIAPALTRSLAGRVVVAHNLAFESMFLQAELARIGLSDLRLPGWRSAPGRPCPLIKVRTVCPGRAGRRGR
jgi:hypothetical protein